MTGDRGRIGRTGFDGEEIMVTIKTIQNKASFFQRAVLSRNFVGVAVACSPVTHS